MVTGHPWMQQYMMRLGDDCYSPVQEQRGQQQHQQQEAEDWVLPAQLPETVHLHPASEFLQKSRDDPHLDSPVVEPQGSHVPCYCISLSTNI